MKTNIANKIVEATCSKTLQHAIKKNKFIVAEQDLLILAYVHAPDYNTRLALLRLIVEDAEDKSIKDKAKACIEYVQINYEKFIAQETDCIFEVKIKSESGAYEEHYITKSFQSAHQTIQNFCAYYDVTFTKQTRFSIVKRKFTDDMTRENFDEDWVGEANYKETDILVNVAHIDLRDKTILAGYVLQLPAFIRDQNLVCYTDDDGIQHFGIFWGNIHNTNDDCALITRLYEKALSGQGLKTKEHFYEHIFNMHEHIEFPRLDILKISDAPNEIKKEYYIFKRLHQKYKEA